MNSEPKIEIKSVKHTFAPEERNQIGSDLARAIGGLRGIEVENDQVKAAFKARITEAEARIDNLSTSLINGFEMRNARCLVVYFPKERKKHYFLETADGKPNGAPAVLIEDMTGDDFQVELVQAESKFDLKEEIDLFQKTDTDSGIVVVGKFAGKWFSAARVKIGKLTLTERLDSEQKAFKLRADAVSTAVKRVNAWAKENLKEHSKGFEDSFANVIIAHQERVE